MQIWLKIVEFLRSILKLHLRYLEVSDPINHLSSNLKMTKISNLQKFQFALCLSAALFMMTFAKLEGDKKSCCVCVP